MLQLLDIGALTLGTSHRLLCSTDDREFVAAFHAQVFLFGHRITPFGSIYSSFIITDRPVVNGAGTAAVAQVSPSYSPRLTSFFDSFYILAI